MFTNINSNLHTFQIARLEESEGMKLDINILKGAKKLTEGPESGSDCDDFLSDEEMDLSLDSELIGDETVAEVQPDLEDLLKQGTS